MNQFIVCPSCGLLIVGATVTFAVNVVVKTLLNVQSTVIAVAENATATGAVCALPATATRAKVGLFDKTTAPEPVDVVVPVPPDATGNEAPRESEAM
jgi:hypothetical protein